MVATVLLTGATGRIGSRLLRVLEEGGCFAHRHRIVRAGVGRVPPRVAHRWVAAVALAVAVA